MAPCTHVLDRAKIGRQREDALSEIVALRDRIVTARAETLADAAAQLWRLVVMADEVTWFIAASQVPSGQAAPGSGRPMR